MGTKPRHVNGAGYTVSLPSRGSLRRRAPIAWAQLMFRARGAGGVAVAKTVDPDFRLHLRTGQLIVESGIPRDDPLSWTAAASPG